MTTARILVFAGSLRSESFNRKLAEAAARRIEAKGGLVTRLDLGDYPLPIYHADVEGAGIPEAALALHDQFSSHNGIFIASPEYNSFPPPLLLNALDWLSRVRHNEGGMIEAFEKPAFAIGSASPGILGGYRALTALRHKLSLGLGAMVVPAMTAVMAAYQAFDADGNLHSDGDKAMLDKTIGQLRAAVAR